MKYVRAFSSLFAGLLLAAAFSSSAVAEPTDALLNPVTQPDNNTYPDKLQSFALTDADIAAKCEASIRIQANLVEVTDPDGGKRKITKCEQVYEAQREAANRYNARINEARVQVAAPVNDCAAAPGTNTQENCVKASVKVVTEAKVAHEDLAVISDDEITRLAAFAAPGTVNSTSIIP